MSSLDLVRPNHPRESTITEYAYMNADASVLLTVVRKDRPDGKRIYRKPRGIKKPSRGYPLLDLPSLIATPERPLLVVEGEKTAEHARHLLGDRYATTTAIGGAGKAHQTDWSPAKDREVVIWPDADEVGRHHAEHVAEQCVKAAAKSVRTVDTDGLPDGWDLADLPPDGMDIEALLEGADRFVLDTRFMYKSIEYRDGILTMDALMDREETRRRLGGGRSHSARRCRAHHRETENWEIHAGARAGTRRRQGPFLPGAGHVRHAGPIRLP